MQFCIYKIYSLIMLNSLIVILLLMFPLDCIKLFDIGKLGGIGI